LYMAAPDYLGGIMNLLKETEKILKQNRKSLDDIKWVGCTTHDWHDWKQFDGIKTKSEFIKWADFEYDNGYGLAKEEVSLTVAGDDWWLERHGYDGSEWWEFKTLPKKSEFKEAK